MSRHWVPPLAWMAVIWWLSSDVGSAEHTVGLLAWIVAALAPWITPAHLDVLHLLLRKLGHLTEYAVLAALWFRALNAGRGLAPSAAAVGAFGLSVAWAIVDEIHQASIPSRTASPADVLIDATGATLALVACHLHAARRRSTPARGRNVSIRP